MVVDANVFCVRENAVTVLNATDLYGATSFPGTFVAQSQTASNWAGVRDDNGVLSVVFRDTLGKEVKGGDKIGKFKNETIFMESAGDAAFVAIGCGEVFRGEGANAKHIYDAGKHVRIAGIATDARGLLVTHQNAEGVWLTVLDPRGKTLHRSAVIAKSISHQPVLLDDKLYLFDDAKSEVVTVSLDTLLEVRRSPIEGITSVGRLLAIGDESGASLAIMSQNADARPLAVYLHSVQSGATARVCPLNAANAEIAYANGHIVVSSTSSMQNLIQVFNAYAPALARAA
jgi:hypothetical protein